MSQPVSQFITDLAIHFGRKHDTPEAEKAWLQSMFSSMRGYNADVLRRAADKIIGTRTERSFPLPAECKRVCEEIQRFDETTKPRALIDHPHKNDAMSEWRWRLADDLIMCPMGREAAKDGWIGALHDFARENGRLPTGSEISKCKADAKGFDEAFMKCARGECGELSKSLTDLGQTMLKRREKLRARVLGEKAA